jgi:hypothetical protein
MSHWRQLSALFFKTMVKSQKQWYAQGLKINDATPE